MYVSYYNRNYLEKIYRKSKKSYEQNVLKIQFYICYANIITIGESPYRIISIYICKTINVIIVKNKSNNKKFSRTKFA